MLYLYDPINNVKIPTTYDLIAGMSGYSKSGLATMKCKRKKLKSINCYIIDENTDKKTLREFRENENPKDEIWKIAPGTQGKYEISTYGRLRNRETKYLMTPCPNSKGILGTYVSINNKKVTLRIHKLVAEAFLFKPLNCNSVIHKGSKHNNHVDNLKWVSWKEAVVINGKSKDTQCKPVYKLDLETYEIIDEYESIRQAARENYVDKKWMSVAANDIRKSCGGFRWCLVDKYEEVMRGIGVMNHVVL